MPMKRNPAPGPQASNRVATPQSAQARRTAPSILRAFDRLEVGPVRVERRRLIAPYRVFAGGQAHSTELMYRYEEDVFDPRRGDDENLAAVIAAQVALNYGLFTDEIVIHGALDDADRRFLTEMAENTAREIYVKKFLSPNPFLVGPARSLPPEPCGSYCRAALRFDETDSRPRAGSTATSVWETDREKYLLLSSGGKDSLLSFGLLNEAGHEVHPVFVNESGRHWFTALNAYRHFRDHVPHTGRVWTNSDRVFSWMLRRLPFIREDFAELRSDEYPVRLWTVAVFLFGSLPLARRRGIGRIIIGDEHDTTERSSLHGITHYNGLFDQSRYFDNALTRYYARKQWNLSQFSILRPLSELLIEKTLAERYPALLSLQMSCHAAHPSGSRVRPCGTCEKCRRIVGMLLATGAQPGLCGYTDPQIAACLAQLVEKGVHQEIDVVEHLAFLLTEKGLISSGRIGAHAARPRPHVLRLRFDSERSPVEAVPSDVRRSVYPLLLAHAKGAVRRQGRVWLAYDPLREQELARPYPFEKPRKPPATPQSSRGATDDRGQSTDDFILGHFTWPEARERFKAVDVALLPVGAIEQHGPHLPLDTDAFDAQYMAHEVAKACSPPRPLVLPLIPYGVSYHHDDFSGTISISNNTLANLVYEIGIGVARYGITKLVIINGHGGNVPSLHFAAQLINRDAHIFTCVDTGETSDADVAALAQTPGDIHAGEIETSTTLAVRPELVRLKHARKYVPRFSSRYLDFSSRRKVDWYARTARISRSGVLGDPTKASREKGEKMWAVIIRNMVEFVEHLKSMSLDEIYQRNRF